MNGENKGEKRGRTEESRPHFLQIPRVLFSRSLSIFHCPLLSEILELANIDAILGNWWYIYYVCDSIPSHNTCIETEINKYTKEG